MPSRAARRKFSSHAAKLILVHTGRSSWASIRIAP